MLPVQYTLQRGLYPPLSSYNFEIILYLEKSTATIYMYIPDGHYERHWLTHEGTSIPIPLIVPFGDYLDNGRDHICINHILMVIFCFVWGFTPYSRIFRSYGDVLDGIDGWYNVGHFPLSFISNLCCLCSDDRNDPWTHCFFLACYF